MAAVLFVLYFPKEEIVVSPHNTRDPKLDLPDNEEDVSNKAEAEETKADTEEKAEGEDPDKIPGLALTPSTPLSLADSDTVNTPGNDSKHEELEENSPGTIEKLGAHSILDSSCSSDQSNSKTPLLADSAEVVSNGSDNKNPVKAKSKGVKFNISDASLDGIDAKDRRTSQATQSNNRDSTSSPPRLNRTFSVECITLLEVRHVYRFRIAGKFFCEN